MKLVVLLMMLHRLDPVGGRPRAAAQDRCRRNAGLEADGAAGGRYP
jgi:hypothetical protein